MLQSRRLLLSLRYICLRHKAILVLLCACLIVPLSGQNEGTKSAKANSEAAVNWNSLIGQWKVSLHSSTGEVMGTTMFVITEAGPKSLQGTFYGSPTRQPHLATFKGAIYLAFVTSDQNSVYHTTVRLSDARLEGSTHAIDRGFLSVWTAERL